MTTKVYGTSDDLIEVEGDVSGEVSCYVSDDRENGVLLCFSDGTILEVKYGKFDGALWEVKLRHEGTLFGEIKECTAEDEDAEIYSDVATFKKGLKWAYAATEWEKVK